MDGIEQLSNILIVGTTNRRDLVDPAILRPGRFDIQMEIGLPDREGRQQILQIHTKSMRENGLLDAASVDMKDLAAATDSFTAAELEGLGLGDEVAPGVLIFRTFATQGGAGFLFQATSQPTLFPSNLGKIALLFFLNFLES